MQRAWPHALQRALPKRRSVQYSTVHAATLIQQSAAKQHAVLKKTIEFIHPAGQRVAKALFVFVNVLASLAFSFMKGIFEAQFSPD